VRWSPWAVACPKGGATPFYRWLTRDIARCFLAPERTRLFRLLSASGLDADSWLPRPCLGSIDTYGIELIHPMREGRSPQQMVAKASPTIAGLSGANSVSY